MPLVTDGLIEDEISFTNLPIIFWKNAVTATNVSTLQGQSDPDFPVANVANPSLSLKWKQDFTDSPVQSPCFIIVDFSSTFGPINYVAIAGHNLGTIGASIGLFGDGNPSGDSPAATASPSSQEWVTGFVPEDDSPLVIMFGEIEAQPGDRHRAVLVLGNQSSTPMEIAVVYVGYATVLEDGIQADHTPLPLATVHDVVTGQSENGSFLGRIQIGQWQESTATIANMDTDWARDNMLPFMEHAAEEPFFWAWSPGNYPEEVSFAWLTNDPQLVFDIDGYVSIDLGMKGIAE
jgi:hypothetical protein